MIKLSSKGKSQIHGICFISGLLSLFFPAVLLMIHQLPGGVELQDFPVFISLSRPDGRDVNFLFSPTQNRTRSKDEKRCEEAAGFGEIRWGFS